MNGDGHGLESEKGKERTPPAKKTPVFFIDEAHKLCVRAGFAGDAMRYLYARAIAGLR